MPEASSNGSNLCLACGLCCDGSLFERAVLKPGEETQAEKLGLVMISHDSSKPAFAQPCPAFKNENCSVYLQRPNVCKGFKCGLLLKYENGLLGLPEALENVGRVRAMQVELGRLLPNPIQNLPSLAEIKRQMQALTEANQRRAYLDFLMLAAQYEMFLSTHFLRRLPKNLPAEKLPGMGEG
jgi:uncharacterized protein